VYRIISRIGTGIIALIFSTILYGQLPYVCTGGTEYYGVQGFPGSHFIWEIEGGEIINDYNDTVEIRWNYERGDHELRVVEITEWDCIGSPVISSVDVRAPVVDIAYDEVEICNGEEYTFDASGSYTQPVQYLWHNGSNLSEYTSGVDELVWVQVLDGDGCEGYDSVTLIVYDLPEVELPGDTSLCGTQTMELDPGVYSTYEWTDGSIGRYFLAQEAEFIDTIVVTVGDENGCRASDTIIIYQCDLDKYFSDMPNTITPNGDNFNDVWEIPYIHLFPGATLEIFDRWGRLVYRTEDIYGKPWEGRSSRGDELEMGAYYYIIDFGTTSSGVYQSSSQDLGKKKRIKSGTVNLVRD
jgi:gliding motility-associated-like protein